MARGAVRTIVGSRWWIRRSSRRCSGTTRRSGLSTCSARLPRGGAKMVGVRNILVRNYLDIDRSIVHKVLQTCRNDLRAPGDVLVKLLRVLRSGWRSAKPDGPTRGFSISQGASRAERRRRRRCGSYPAASSVTWIGSPGSNGLAPLRRRARRDAMLLGRTKLPVPTGLSPLASLRPPRLCGGTGTRLTWPRRFAIHAAR